MAATKSCTTTDGAVQNRGPAVVLVAKCISKPGQEGQHYRLVSKRGFLQLADNEKDRLFEFGF